MDDNQTDLHEIGISYRLSKDLYICRLVAVFLHDFKILEFKERQSFTSCSIAIAIRSFPSQTIVTDGSIFLYK